MNASYLAIETYALLSWVKANAEAPCWLALAPDAVSYMKFNAEPTSMTIETSRSLLFITAAQPAHFTASYRTQRRIQRSILFIVGLC